MNIMDIIAWIIVGGLAGWVASMIMGTNARQGTVGNVVVGILGAFIGGFVMHLFNNAGASATNAFSWRSFLVALIGAVILLFVYKAFNKNRGAV